MNARPVHDEHRYETELTESVLWRKSRRSPAGAGAACVEVTAAESRPDGSVAVVRPDRPPIIIVQAPTDDLMQEFADESGTQHSSVARPTESSTGSDTTWTRGSLDEGAVSGGVVTQQAGGIPIETVSSPQFDSAHGLPGFENATDQPSAQASEHPGTQEPVSAPPSQRTVGASPRAPLVSGEGSGQLGDGSGLVGGKSTVLSDDPAFVEARRAAVAVPREHLWADPVSELKDSNGNTVVVQGKSGKDVPQRFEVRSGFDVSRFTVHGRNFTDLTVRVRADGQSLGHEDLAGMWGAAKEGAERFLNQAEAHLPSTGDRLHVSIELVGPDQPAHLTVSRAGSLEEMSQHAWFPGASPVVFAHEIAHQIGLRDEYRDENASGTEHRPDVSGSLVGNFWRPFSPADIPEEWRAELGGPLMAHQSLRDRYLHLIDRLVGDDVLLSSGVGHNAQEQLVGHGGADAVHPVTQPGNAVASPRAPRSVRSTKNVDPGGQPIPLVSLTSPDLRTSALASPAVGAQATLPRQGEMNGEVSTHSLDNVRTISEAGVRARIDQAAPTLSTGVRDALARHLAKALASANPHGTHDGVSDHSADTAHASTASGHAGSSAEHAVEEWDELLHQGLFIGAGADLVRVSFAPTTAPAADLLTRLEQPDLHSVRGTSVFTMSSDTRSVEREKTIGVGAILDQFFAVAGKANVVSPGFTFVPRKQLTIGSTITSDSIGGTRLADGPQSAYSSGTTASISVLRKGAENVAFQIDLPEHDVTYAVRSSVVPSPQQSRDMAPGTEEVVEATLPPWQGTVVSPSRLSKHPFVLTRVDTEPVLLKMGKALLDAKFSPQEVAEALGEIAEDTFNSVLAQRFNQSLFDGTYRSGLVEVAHVLGTVSVAFELTAARRGTDITGADAVPVRSDMGQKITIEDSRAHAYDAPLEITASVEPFAMKLGGGGFGLETTTKYESALEEAHARKFAANFGGDLARYDVELNARVTFDTDKTWYVNWAEIPRLGNPLAIRDAVAGFTVEGLTGEILMPSSHAQDFQRDVTTVPTNPHTVSDAVIKFHTELAAQLPAPVSRPDDGADLAESTPLVFRSPRPPMLEALAADRQGEASVYTQGLLATSLPAVTIPEGGWRADTPFDALKDSIASLLGQSVHGGVQVVVQDPGLTAALNEAAARSWPGAPDEPIGADLDQAKNRLIAAQGDHGSLGTADLTNLFVTDPSIRIVDADGVMISRHSPHIPVARQYTIANNGSILRNVRTIVSGGAYSDDVTGAAYSTELGGATLQLATGLGVGAAAIPMAPGTEKVLLHINQAVATLMDKRNRTDELWALKPSLKNLVHYQDARVRAEMASRLGAYFNSTRLRSGFDTLVRSPGFSVEFDIPGRWFWQPRRQYKIEVRADLLERVDGGNAAIEPKVAVDLQTQGDLQPASVVEQENAGMLVGEAELGTDFGPVARFNAAELYGELEVGVVKIRDISSKFSTFNRLSAPEGKADRPNYRVKYNIGITEEDGKGVQLGRYVHSFYDEVAPVVPQAFQAAESQAAVPRTAADDVSAFLHGADQFWELHTGDFNALHHQRLRFDQVGAGGTSVHIANLEKLHDTTKSMIEEHDKAQQISRTPAEYADMWERIRETFDEAYFASHFPRLVGFNGMSVALPWLRKVLPRPSGIHNFQVSDVKSSLDVKLILVPTGHAGTVRPLGSTAVQGPSVMARNHHVSDVQQNSGWYASLFGSFIMGPQFRIGGLGADDPQSESFNAISPSLQARGETEYFNENHTALASDAFTILEHMRDSAVTDHFSAAVQITYHTRFSKSPAVSTTRSYFLGDGTTQVEMPADDHAALTSAEPFAVWQPVPEESEGRRVPLSPQLAYATAHARAFLPGDQVAEAGGIAAWVIGKLKEQGLVEPRFLTSTDVNTRKLLATFDEVSLAAQLPLLTTHGVPVHLDFPLLGDGRVTVVLKGTSAAGPQYVRSSGGKRVTTGTRGTVENAELVERAYAVGAGPSLLGTAQAGPAVVAEPTIAYRTDAGRTVAYEAVESEEDLRRISGPEPDWELNHSTDNYLDKFDLAMEVYSDWIPAEPVRFVTSLAKPVVGPLSRAMAAKPTDPGLAAERSALTLEDAEGFRSAIARFPLPGGARVAMTMDRNLTRAAAAGSLASPPPRVPGFRTHEPPPIQSGPLNAALVPIVHAISVGDVVNIGNHVRYASGYWNLPDSVWRKNAPREMDAHLPTKEGSYAPSGTKGRIAAQALNPGALRGNITKVLRLNYPIIPHGKNSGISYGLDLNGIGRPLPRETPLNANPQTSLTLNAEEYEGENSVAREKAARQGWIDPVFGGDLVDGQPSFPHFNTFTSIEPVAGTGEHFETNTRVADRFVAYEFAGRDIIRSRGVDLVLKHPGSLTGYLRHSDAVRLASEFPDQIIHPDAVDYADEHARRDLHHKFDVGRPETVHLLVQPADVRAAKLFVGLGSANGFAVHLTVLTPGAGGAAAMLRHEVVPAIGRPPVDTRDGASIEHTYIYQRHGRPDFVVNRRIYGPAPANWAVGYRTGVREVSPVPSDRSGEVESVRVHQAELEAAQRYRAEASAQLSLYEAYAGGADAGDASSGTRYPGDLRSERAGQAPRPQRGSGAARSADALNLGAPAADLGAIEGVDAEWAEYKRAQHEYATALENYRQAFESAEAGTGSSQGAEGKRPQTDFQSAAESGLRAAGETLNNAVSVLHGLGIDPARITALEQNAMTESGIDRPRLVGGSRPGDDVLEAGPDGSPLRSTRNLGPHLRLFIDHAPSEETGWLLDVRSGARIDGGRLTEIADHGGIRLHDPDQPAAFREYLPDGTVHTEGEPVSVGHEQSEAGGGRDVNAGSWLAESPVPRPQSRSSRSQRRSQKSRSSRSQRRSQTMRQYAELARRRLPAIPEEDEVGVGQSEGQKVLAPDLVVEAGVPDHLIEAAGDERPSQQAPAARSDSSSAHAVLQGPWYTQAGALGEYTVSGSNLLVDANTAGTLVADGLTAPVGTDPATIEAVGAQVGVVVGEMLTSGGETDAERWRRAWQHEYLRNGHFVAVRSHSVWIRPVVEGLTHDPEPALSADGPKAREYQVNFGGPARISGAEATDSKGLEGLLEGTVNLAGSALASVTPLAPTFTVGSKRTHGSSSSVQVVSGRKLMSVGANEFSAGLKFRVHVDGREWGSDHVLNDVLKLKFPSAFSGEMDHRPDVSTRIPHVALPNYRSPHARIMITAIDTTPFVSDLQQRLRDAKISPDTTNSIMKKLMKEMLSETSIRNRERWWISSGDVSSKMSEGTSLFSTFHGDFTATAKIIRLENITDENPTAKVRLRDDMGLSFANKRGRAGGSSAGLGVSFDLGGLKAAQGGGNHLGYLLFGGAGTSEREHSSSLGSSSMNKTTLMRDTVQERYRAEVQVTITTSSSTHKVAPAVARSIAEIDVPQPEAAEFEQSVLGGVKTPRLEAHTPASVQNRPEVQELLRLTAEQGVLPELTTERPDHLLDAGEHDPAEPLAVAARRGQSFGMLLSLPGSERVYNEITSVLHGKVAAAQGPVRRTTRTAGIARGVDWSQAHRDLSTHFGTPALEGDMQVLLSGIEHSMRIDGQRYDVSVAGHMGRKLDQQTYDLTVNARATGGDTVSSTRSRKRSLELSANGSARLKLKDFAKLEIGDFGVGLSGGQSRNTVVSWGAKTYRRTETVGEVNDNLYAMVYEVKVRTGGEVETWYVSGDDVAARFAIPVQHRPESADAVEQEEHAPVQAGPAEAERQDSPERSSMSAASALLPPVEVGAHPPASAALDFSEARTDGLYPVFTVIPELAEQASRLYHEINGIPWSDQRWDWPETIRSMAKPTSLQNGFDAAVGTRGWIERLPDHQGWKQAVKIDLALHETTHEKEHFEKKRVDAPDGSGTQVEVHGDGDVEIEWYQQSAGQVSGGLGTNAEVGLSAGLGPIFTPGKQDEASSTGAIGEKGTSRKASNQISAKVSGSVSYGRHQLTTPNRGSIDITRTTYSGPVHAYRSNPFFTVTAMRWKADVEQSRSQTVYAPKSLEFIIPERRAQDLNLPLVSPARQQSLPDITLQAEPPRPQDGQALPVDDSAQPAQAVLAMVEPELAISMSHPELLHADQVLDAIVGTLRDHGVLRPQTAEIPGGRPNDLMQYLEKRFNSRALQNDLPNLRRTGVVGWYPIPRQLGASRHVWVRVTGELGDVESSVPRKDAKLTLRTENFSETETETGVAKGAEGLVHVQGAAGVGDARIGAGLEAGYSGNAERSDGLTSAMRDIFRVGTTDKSVEFTMGMRYAVEIGVTTEPPEIARLLVQATKRTMFEAADLLAENDLGGTTMRDLWYQNRPWHWFETVTDRPAAAAQTPAAAGPQRVPLSGSIRLLTPEHLTTTAPRHPAITEPSDGQDVVWLPKPDANTVHSPALPREAFSRLTEVIHPNSVPATLAINKWAAQTAVPAHRRNADPEAGQASVPEFGLDTLPGLQLAYLTNDSVTRADIVNLLQHSRRIPVRGKEVTVGVDVVNATRIDDAVFKARRYTQLESASGGVERSGGGFGAKVEFVAGDELDDGNRFFGGEPAYREGRNLESSFGGGAGEVDESDKEQKVGYRYYSMDVDVVIDGPYGAVRMRVPNGLYAMMPAHDGDFLEQNAPDVFGDAAREPSQDGTSQAGAIRENEGPAGQEQKQEQEQISEAASPASGTEVQVEGSGGQLPADRADSRSAGSADLAEVGEEPVPPLSEPREPVRELLDKPLVSDTPQLHTQSPTTRQDESGVATVLLGFKQAQSDYAHAWWAAHRAGVRHDQLGESSASVAGKGPRDPASAEADANLAAAEEALNSALGAVAGLGIGPVHEMSPDFGAVLGPQPRHLHADGLDPHPVTVDPAVYTVHTADSAPKVRFSGAPEGVGWAHARWAQSWGLQFDSAAGSLYDALLTAGGGSVVVGGHVLEGAGALRQVLGERIGLAEPSADALSAAAARLGASVLILRGDGTMSAHGWGPPLVVAEAAPEYAGADGAQRWVGLPANSADPALAGVSGAQVHWAVSEGRRFVGPSGGFFGALSSAGHASGVPELDHDPQVLRGNLVRWMRTGLTDSDWGAILSEAGIPAPHDAAAQQRIIASVQRDRGGDAAMHRLLPQLASRSFGVGVQVVDTDGAARIHGEPGAGPLATVAPAAGSHGSGGEGAWVGLAAVRPPRVAGAGTRPADVAGGLGWPDPIPAVTVAADRADSSGAVTTAAGPADSAAATHAVSGLSAAQQEWAQGGGRQIVEVAAGPDSLFHAILRSAGGGFTVQGEYVNSPARLRVLMADEVKSALDADLGLSLVAHTIYAALTDGDAARSPSSDALIDSGGARAEITDSVRNPGFRTDLADELVPYFANRFGLGVRVVDPSGAVGRYGSGRPVYVTWTADANGARQWMAALSAPSRYALSSPLRSPNRSDPALVNLAHAIDARKSALRADGTSEFGSDPVLGLLHDAQNRWLGSGTPRSVETHEPEPLVESWHPGRLEATVTQLAQAAHTSVGGTGAVADATSGKGLGLGMAIKLFNALFPQGIAHEPSAAAAESVTGRRGPVSGLPADQWVMASLPDLVGGLPIGGAALLLGDGRTVVVVDTPDGQRMVDFGPHEADGQLVGRVAVPMPGITAEIAAAGNGPALVVDSTGRPVSAGDLQDALGHRLHSAVGWSSEPALREAGTATDSGERIPVGVSEDLASWAQQHGAGFRFVEPSPNSLFDAVLTAAGGAVHVNGAAVADAPPLRQALAGHVREKTAVPNSLRDFPAIQAAFAFEGPERVFEEFFDQNPTGANVHAVHRQIDEHIDSGKAAQYLAEAIAEPGHWEQITQLTALDALADLTGHGLLVVDPHGQVHLHGDPAAPRLAVARVGSESADRPGWAALVPAESSADSFDHVAVDTATSLTPRTEVGTAAAITEPQRAAVASGKLAVMPTEAGSESFYHAVLTASGGAIQIDRNTLVTTPADLRHQLASLVLDRPDVIDTAARQRIAQDLGIGEAPSNEELIDALADQSSRDGEAIASQLIGSYLGTELNIVGPDGAKSTYGTGRPITIISVGSHQDASHWAALVPKPRTVGLGPGQGVKLESSHDEISGLQTAPALGVDERVRPALWASESFTLRPPDKVQTEDPWRSTSFCVEIDGETACVSVAVLTLDAELAARLGVTMS